MSLCRDLTLRGTCPRGIHCTFAHSDEELEKYRNKRHSNRSSATKSDEGGIMSEVHAVTNQMKLHAPNGNKQRPGYMIQQQNYNIKPPVEYNNNTITQSMMYSSPPPPLHYVPGIFSPPPPVTTPVPPLIYRTEDEFVPFESPIRNKFGPISRADNMGKQSPSSASPASLANMFLMSGPGNYITPQPYSPGNKANTASKLFEDIKDIPVTFENNPQLDYDLFEKDLNRLKLQCKDYKDGEEFGKFLGGQTSRSWTDDSCCWTSEEYRSDDDESYEVGIAHDMRELELRWEVELEEHEKRWSSEEDPVANKH